MKKLLSLLLVVALLAGCTAAPAAEPTTAPTAEPTNAPTVAAEPVKNLIIIIGDGMGPNQLEAGQLYAGERYAFTSWPSVKVNTNSVNAEGEAIVTTDSAASATALATGTLTINGTVGRDPEGKDLITILDIAKDLGMATGVVTSDLMSGATPSGFSAHAADRDDTEDILRSQTASGINLLCSNTTPAVSGVYAELTSAGYTFYDNIKKVSMEDEYSYWQINMPESEKGDKLPQAATAALDFLSKDPDGFVLMIEEAKIDSGGHNNDMRRTLNNMTRLANTVDAVMEWIGDRTDTAVLITADHETGGLLLGADGEYTNRCPCPDGTYFSYEYTTDGHSPPPVWLFMYGIEPDLTPYLLEEGLIKNISIFSIMEAYLLEE